MPRTRILVADASRAALYDARLQGWELLQEYEHPTSRAYGRDLTTGRPGRTKNTGVGEGARSAMDPVTNPRAVEAEKFARELAEVLRRGVVDEGWSRIAIVAPPHFLGLLRDNLDAQVSRRVVATLAKDYTRQPPGALADALREQLSPA